MHETTLYTYFISNMYDPFMLHKADNGLLHVDDVKSNVPSRLASKLDKYVS